MALSPGTNLNGGYPGIGDEEEVEGVAQGPTKWPLTWLWKGIMQRWSNVTDYVDQLCGSVVGPTRGCRRKKAKGTASDKCMSRFTCADVKARCGDL